MKAVSITEANTDLHRLTARRQVRHRRSDRRIWTNWTLRSCAQLHGMVEARWELEHPGPGERYLA